MKKKQIFMFHFAGGNQYSFRFLEPFLINFQLEQIELPGRGMKSEEELITDFTTAVDYTFNQVKSKLYGGEFILYGHSMGALLAFRVTKILEEKGIKPHYLIVSGNPGPKIMENRKRYLLEDLDFIKAIRKLGGLPEEVLQNKELMGYFMPILRADFQISEENNLDDTSIINTPIYSLMGELEEYCFNISNWGKYTTAQFDYQILSGNHFFIHNHPEILSRIIVKCAN